MEYKDRQDELEENMRAVTELEEEFYGIMGMLDEIKIKTQLYREKLSPCKEGEDLTEEAEKELNEVISKMNEDLDTYSNRIEEIYEELSIYGIHEF